MQRINIQLTDELLEILEGMGDERDLGRGPLIETLLQSHDLVADYCKRKKKTLGERPGRGRPWPKKAVKKKKS